MKTVLVASALVGGAVAGNSAAKVTPVEKVSQLLTKLSAKVEEEGQAEAVAYDKFACFCKDQADNKLYATENSQEKIDKLTADIDLLETEITDHNTAADEANTTWTDATTESETEVAARDTERVAYEGEDLQVTKAIKAVRGAIEALQGGQAFEQVDMSLLQKAASLASLAEMTEAEQSRLSELVNQPVGRTKSLEGSAGAGGQNAYEYHSNEIIELLQRLMKQFKARKEKILVGEQVSKHAHDKEEMSRQHTISMAKADEAENRMQSSKKSAVKEGKEADKTQETADMDADKAFLKELTGDCEKKATNFDQRVETRNGELKALSEAIAKLSVGVSNYGANKKLALSQQAPVEEQEYQVTEADQDEISSEADEVMAQESTSFIQTASSSMSPKNARVFDLIKNAAQKLKSPALSALAMNMQADHFVKVRKLINDLIERLKAQAESEATHKDYCDKNIKKETTKRDEKQSEMEAENAAIAENKVTIKTLNKEISELKVEIADLQAALQTASKLRTAERLDNDKTIEDAKAGKESVEGAITILKGFYGEDTAALMQIRAHQQQPTGGDREGNTVRDLRTEGAETFDEEYDGNKAAAKGIFGLLDVILTDYDRTVTDVTAAEDLAQTEFETFETNTNDDITEKQGSVKTKEGEVSDEQDAQMTNEDDLEAATGENQSALDQLAILTADCIDGAVSHEERVKRREQEIESLKEALNILEDMAFLQKRK